MFRTVRQVARYLESLKALYVALWRRVFARASIPEIVFS